MVATLALKMDSTNPRSQRIARIALAGLTVSTVWWLFSTQLASIDLAAFHEIEKGFSDLSVTRAWQDLSPDSVLSPVASACYLAGLLMFTTAAIWTGYKLQLAGRIVVALQLTVFSIIYGWATWQVFSAPGRPVGMFLAVVLATLVGALLKSRDQEKRGIEAKNIELKLRNQELLESRLAMVKSDEAERRLLAADLHDQVLNDLRQVLQKFEHYSGAGEHDSNTAGAISGQLKQTMNDIREIMDDLCPVMLDEFGLGAAVEDRLDKAASQHRLDVRFSNTVTESELSSLSSVERQLLYRLVQESITNICKHANATTVKVSLQSEDSMLVMRVSDNGKGIDPAKLKTSSRGTLYMRLRAGLIGATISWKPQPTGTGTLVEIRRPWQ
jgi:signal transduction histidine kinase